jgi:hypothetical protein
MYYSASKNRRSRSWLRHFILSRKVVGSIPEGVIGIFHWRSPSDQNIAMISTQPPTEMSTRDVCLEIRWPMRRLTTIPYYCAICLEIWEHQSLGNLGPCPGLKWDCFTLHYDSTYIQYSITYWKCRVVKFKHV